MNKVKKNGPIFIVGAPRSGTTMLQYRLRNHPNISFPTGESHFFIPLYESSESFGDLRLLRNVKNLFEVMYTKNPGFFEGELHGFEFNVDEISKEFHADGCETISSLVSALFEKNAKEEGKLRWGDKTPYYVMHIPKLLEWFPGAQIIHLIRDGRDVALSLFGRRHDFSVYNSAFAAEYWESYVERGQEYGASLSSEQYYEIRYEDLLSDPNSSMKKLCDFLGEPYSETIFKTSNEEVLGVNQTPLVHQQLKPDNAGKWRAQMAPRQIQYFERVAGQTLKKNGYELLTSGKPVSIFHKIGYRLHNRLFTLITKASQRK